MLGYRLLSAAIVISIALVFVYLDAVYPISDCSGFWMVPLGAYLVFGSAVECIGMISRSSVGSIRGSGYLGTAGVMLAATIPVYWPLSGEPYPTDCPLGPFGWPLAAAAIALVGTVAWQFRSYEPHSHSFQRAILAGWVSVYFGCCFAFAVGLRLTGEASWGLYLLVGVILVTKFSDAGAYFAGRALGRTKLCPNVSPGKTIEGLIGGMVVAIIAATIYFRFCAPLAFDETSISWLGVIALGVALTLAGVMGDLVESIVKREMGCKDSGTLLPGLGGLWDVTDSLLPACVAGYLVVMTGLLEGPG